MQKEFFGKNYNRFGSNYLTQIVKNTSAIKHVCMDESKLKPVLFARPISMASSEKNEWIIRNAICKWLTIILAMWTDGPVNGVLQAYGR